MSEITQGVLIGILISSIFWVLCFLCLIKYVEQLWKHVDLRSTFAFHFFCTRSKWKSYYRTLFQSHA